MYHFSSQLNFFINYFSSTQHGHTFINVHILAPQIPIPNGSIQLLKKIITIKHHGMAGAVQKIKSWPEIIVKYILMV